MKSRTYEIVKKAIIEKKQIVALYDGHRRELCPHVIGTKNGWNQALFYQFGGTSSSRTIELGSSKNWRCMKIDNLSIEEVRDGEWYSASNHIRPNTCVDEVDVEVEY